MEKEVKKYKKSKNPCKITNWYLEYLKTNDEKLFKLVYKELKFIILSFESNNGIFKSDVGITFNDLYNDLWLKLLSKKETFTVEKGSFVTYAYTIFRNNIIDRGRREDYKSKYANRLTPDRQINNKYYENSFDEIHI